MKNSIIDNREVSSGVEIFLHDIDAERANGNIVVANV